MYSHNLATATSLLPSLARGLFLVTWKCSADPLFARAAGMTIIHHGSQRKACKLRIPSESEKKGRRERKREGHTSLTCIHSDGSFHPWKQKHHRRKAKLETCRKEKRIQPGGNKQQFNLTHTHKNRCTHTHTPHTWCRMKAFINSSSLSPLALNCVINV